jgi:hypothetical protein
MGRSKSAIRKLDNAICRLCRSFSKPFPIQISFIHSSLKIPPPWLPPYRTADDSQSSGSSPEPSTFRVLMRIRSLKITSNQAYEIHIREMPASIFSGSVFRFLMIQAKHPQSADGCLKGSSCGVNHYKKYFPTHG